MSTGGLIIPFIDYRLQWSVADTDHRGIPAQWEAESVALCSPEGDGVAFGVVLTMEGRYRIMVQGELVTDGEEFSEAYATLTLAQMSAEAYSLQICLHAMESADRLGDL